MATVEEAARGVVAAVNGVSYLLAARWVADRYKQVFAKKKAKHLRRIEQLYVPGEISSGEATFTRDSDVVTGDATARALWTTDVVGRHIRGSVTWYRIDGLTVSAGNVALKLEKKYAEDQQGALAYKIVQRYTALPSDVRWLGEGVVCMRTRMALEKMSFEELNLEAPARDRVGATQPSTYCETQDIIVDGKVCKAVEIYPYMKDSELYACVVYPRVPDLKLGDQLPPEVDEHVLREGAIADAYRHLMLKALNETPPQVEKAAVLRNEFRTQETHFAKLSMDAVRADGAVDDLTFILKRANAPIRSWDITNAREEVMSRWPR